MRRRGRRAAVRCRRRSISPPVIGHPAAGELAPVGVERRHAAGRCGRRDRPWPSAWPSGDRLVGQLSRRSPRGRRRSCSGLTMQQRSTVSPFHDVGRRRTTARSASCAVAPRLVLRAASQPVRRNSDDRQLGLDAAARGAARRAIRSAPCVGDAQRRLDRVAVGVGAVRGEAEPERQAAGPARQVVGVVAARSTRPVVASCSTSRYSACWVWAAWRSVGSRYSSAHESNGANSHLCGSTMKLSACSMPAKRSRTLGAASAGAAVGAVDVQPRAEVARTRRRRRRGRRSRRRSSCRHVATIANSRSRSSVAERVDRRLAGRRPRMRPAASAGTSTTSASITRAAWRDRRVGAAST